jgi:hypothetical protein
MGRGRLCHWLRQARRDDDDDDGAAPTSSERKRTRGPQRSTGGLGRASCGAAPGAAYGLSGRSISPAHIPRSSCTTSRTLPSNDSRFINSTMKATGGTAND